MIRSSEDVYSEFKNIFKLPENVKRFALIAAVNEPAKIECEYFADIEDMNEFKTKLEKFEICKKRCR